MGTSRRRKPRRRRVGRVSYYQHHGGWWAYYQEGGVPVRKHVAGDEITAERIAAQINAQLAASAPHVVLLSDGDDSRAAAGVSRPPRARPAVLPGDGQSLCLVEAPRDQHFIEGGCLYAPNFKSVFRRSQENIGPRPVMPAADQD